MHCSLEKHDVRHIEHHKRLHAPVSGIDAAARYVCVYLLNKTKKYAFVYGGDDCSCFMTDQKYNALYSEAVQKAFGGDKVSYEWIKEGPAPLVYQNTLLPLSDDNGDVDNVLGVVKILDNIGAEAPKGITVAENAGQSFVRLLINAREEEKRKISSALHDEIGTAAVVINSLLGILKEDIKDNKKTAALGSVKEVSEAFEHSVSRIKKVIIDLRPPQLEEIGLNSAVKNLVDTLSNSVPLKINYSYKIKESVRMSDTVKITLYRVVQEAVNNTLKHAKAKTINIAFSENENTILLDIQDDGVGYPGAHNGTVNKLGILGMKENLSYIGGSIRIKGIKGKGTRISVACPKITYVRSL